jgi:hypothetical protein
MFVFFLDKRDVQIDYHHTRTCQTDLSSTINRQMTKHCYKTLPQIFIYNSLLK